MIEEEAMQAAHEWVKQQDRPLVLDKIVCEGVVYTCIPIAHGYLTTQELAQKILTIAQNALSGRTQPDGLFILFGCLADIESLCQEALEGAQNP